MKRIFLLSILCSLFACSQKQDELVIWFDEPARLWEETLPLGNGRIGMMPDGGIEHESIVLNDITLWSGSEIDNSNPKALEALPQIREFLLEGKNYEAQQLMYDNFVCGGVGTGYGSGAKVPFGCFQTLGTLSMDFVYPSQDSVSEFRRGLSLNDASAFTTFTKDGIRYQRDYFVSRKDDVAVIRLSADRKDCISFQLQLSRPECASVKAVENALTMSGQLSSGVDGVGGMRYFSMVSVQNEGGTVAYSDDGIIVDSATEVKIIFSTGTDYSDDFDESFVENNLKTAQTMTYEQLRQNHEASYKELFDRVSLDLEHTVVEKPIDERLADFQIDDDSYLPMLYFQYGRYLLISSTREDLLPPNLQGLWANTIQTPWNGDYHLNINVQMNHWPCEVCNLSELHLPLAKMTQSIVASGEKTAKDFYDAQGWTAHVTLNPWHYTAPGEHPSWGATNTGGAWLALHLWQHYQFTRDTAFLSEMYPVMKGAALFFKDILIEEPTHGWLVTAPTTSPENAFYLPDGNVASVCMGSTMDVQIITELFDAVASASDVLQNEDARFVFELDSLKRRFPPYQVSKEGYLQEWLEDYKETDIHHRHVSHLFGLHPGSLITKTKTPELFSACRTTLDRRGDEGTGWSRAWKINFWARLGDGDRAYRLLKNLLEPSLQADGSQKAGTYPNLFCAHPPFQIDGNFGGTAGIAEMLLQSHDGFIELLPALPKTWQNGSFKGLCAVGGVVVDCTWKEGKPLKVTLTSTTGGHYKLLMPEEQEMQFDEFDLEKGASKTYRF